MEENKTEKIEFSKSVVRMFNEMRRRQNREINDALTEVYEELGVRERVDAQDETKETIIIDPKMTYIEFIMPPKEKKDGPEPRSKTK